MAISLIVSSHGLFAQEALNAATMIVGEPRMTTEVVSVVKGRSYDECLAELQEKYAAMAGADGTLILVDIFGGTPSNISSFLALTAENVQVYSGLNLPMLIELIAMNPQTIAEAKTIIETAAANSLTDITAKIKATASNDDDFEL